MQNVIQFIKISDQKWNYFWSEVKLLRTMQNVIQFIKISDQKWNYWEQRKTSFNSLRFLIRSETTENNAKRHSIH